MVLRENKLTYFLYKLAHKADIMGEDKLCDDIDNLIKKYREETLNKEDKRIIAYILLIKKWI